MSQNIFDNDIFFSEYMKLRGQKNYNDLLEQPAMAQLLPDVRGKRILDIGCGYGQCSLRFAQGGAEKVVAIDLSEKMLALAKKDYHHPRITYLRMDMADISQLSQSFDLIYSSLAFHYAADFQKLIGDVYHLLESGGQLLYSQEHPIVTASTDGHFNKDSKGNYISYTFTDYGKSGQRSGPWFVDDVINYHRPMGEIVSTLAHTGFCIEDLVEPLPQQWALKEMPDLAKEFIKPAFLIIKAKKSG